MFADHGLASGNLILLVVCLFVAFAFEFANGFHDTANAVATVIYTNALPARIAVALSGVCNFIGVFIGGLGVAMGILALLPVDLLVAGGTGASLAMVLALLLAAITWNVGTWYFGLPASSSHTLIGAILGVGVAHSALPGHTFGDGVNWTKAGEIGLSLLISPMFGFGLAALLVLIMRRYARNRALLEPPAPGATPPPGTRALLIATCSGVSLAHGSNDGQKGVGLVMLILMGLLPAQYALNHRDPVGLEKSVVAARELETMVLDHGDRDSAKQVNAVVGELQTLRETLIEAGQVAQIPSTERFEVRRRILSLDHDLRAMQNEGALGLSSAEAEQFERARTDLRGLTEYAPDWVIAGVALALGLGTMVGWRRIVVTIGEKIGKGHLTYGQGASAELVAASTIGVSAWLGLPVSTTHVLSSGVAGTMVALRLGVQRTTVRNIGIAWLLTLPVSMTLSAVFFWVLYALLG